MDGFIIISNINAVAYKEFFPLLKDGKVNTGYAFNKTLVFETPKGETKKQCGICWYTTFPIPNKKKMALTAAYDPDKYPKYDNYDAIEVGRVEDIPKDYDGVMGVPISFLGKYNSNQFEIVGCTESEGKGFSNGLWDKNSGVAQPLVSQKRVYKRIFIRFEILWIASGHSKTSMPKDVAELISADFEMKSKDNTGNGYAILNGTQLYHRILIRKVKDKEEEL